MFDDGRITREGGELGTTSSAPTHRPGSQRLAGASGFGGVIRELQAAGHPVVAPPNPLRSLAFYAAAIGALVGAIDGPLVLVGHSYGVGANCSYRLTPPVFWNARLSSAGGLQRPVGDDPGIARTGSSQRVGYRHDLLCAGQRCYGAHCWLAAGRLRYQPRTLR